MNVNSTFIKDHSKKRRMLSFEDYATIIVIAAMFLLWVVGTVIACKDARKKADEEHKHEITAQFEKCLEENYNLDFKQQTKNNK